MFNFGGGWVGGSPTQFLKQSQYLATRGMLGIRVEYRTIPKDDKRPPPVCCADANSAPRYVRAHAAEGIDPQRIAGAGGSAGGSGRLRRPAEKYALRIIARLPASLIFWQV